MFNGLKKFINWAGRKMVDVTAETIISGDSKTWLESKLTAWIDSEERKAQLDAERYYLGDQDICHRERLAIGDTGRLEPIKNVVNNRILDNVFRHMVDQKSNFSFGKPMLLKSENETAVDTLKEVFNENFDRLLSSLSEKVITSGRAALYPYYDEDGDFSFEVFKASELMPVWKDSIHTKLLFCVRYYKIEKQKNFGTETVEKVQIFTKEACYNFIRSGGRLKPDTEAGDVTYYMTADRVVDSETNTIEKVAYGWDKVPIVFFRFNNDEQPLLNQCRSLQDAYNEVWSNFKNQMDEDPGQTILILKNIGGEKLGEFRRNLSQYRAIKVQTNVNGIEGGVDTLSVEVNAANYQLILKELKKAIVTQCRGFDVKDETLGGNANKLHISAMYNDCEIDARKIETEFQASLKQLLFFVTAHLANTGKGNISGVDFKFQFDRDMIQDWQGDMSTLISAGAKYSQKWLLSQTPGVDDPDEIIKDVEEENKAAMEEYSLPMPQSAEANNNGGEE